MNPRPHLSAAQLAVICIAAGPVVGCAYFLLPLFYPSFEHIGYFHQLSILAVFSLPGAILMGLALKQLRLGIENEQWPSASVGTLRANMDSRYWRAAYISCGLVFVGSLFVGDQLHLLGWGAYFSCSGLYAVQNQLKYPNDRPGASLNVAPKDATRLTSNHWGQP